MAPNRYAQVQIPGRKVIFKYQPLEAPQALHGALFEESGFNELVKVNKDAGKHQVKIPFGDYVVIKDKFIQENAVNTNK